MKPNAQAAISNKNNPTERPTRTVSARTIFLESPLSFIR